VSGKPEPRKGRPAYRSKAWFRDTDGQTRTVYAQTKGRIRQALLAALGERKQAAAAGLVHRHLRDVLFRGRQARPPAPRRRSARRDPPVGGAPGPHRRDAHRARRHYTRRAAAHSSGTRTIGPSQANGVTHARPRRCDYRPGDGTGDDVVWTPIDAPVRLILTVPEATFAKRPFAVSRGSLCGVPRGDPLAAAISRRRTTAVGPGLRHA
jgi:hypothetical protein